MSYQFVHMESYSRKGNSSGRSTSFVFAEARREPEASLHVAQPHPPEIIYGTSIETVEQLHSEKAEAARTIPKGGKPRRIRQDQHTLLTIIASHPHTVSEVRSDPDKRDEIDQWETLTIGWLKAKYGDKLHSVIRHTDEAHWHIHSFVLPDDPEMKANSLHPGHVAKAKIMNSEPISGEDSKALNKRGDLAYKSAMKDWQDSYYHHVAAPCGLTRQGPGHRRLTRGEWQAEKTQARALYATTERAKRAELKSNAFIESTKREATKITSEAGLLISEARHEKQRAFLMMKRARKEVAHVQSMRSKLQHIPTILRTLWDGFRKSRIREKIEQEVQARVISLHTDLTEANKRERDSQKARLHSELQTKNLRASIREMALQLHEAHLKISKHERTKVHKPDYPPSPKL